MTPSEALQALAQAAVEYHDASLALHDWCGDVGERIPYELFMDEMEAKDRLTATARAYARTQEQPHG